MSGVEGLKAALKQIVEAVAYVETDGGRRSYGMKPSFAPAFQNACAALSAIEGGGGALQPSASVPTEREVRLVLAARAVAFGDGPTREAIKELDAASEAYAADVPWDDEPERLCVCVERGDGPEGCGLCNETGQVPSVPTEQADGGGE